MRAVTRISVADCTSGYRCWRREALERLPLDSMVSNGYAFIVEMLYEASGAAAGSARSRLSSSSDGSGTARFPGGSWPSP